MAASSDDTIAALVARADGGDVEARGALFSALYDDLHRLAQSHVRRSAGPITLGATTLLHEAYLVDGRARRRSVPRSPTVLWLCLAGNAGLVINYVRDRRAQKRGGELTFTTLDDGAVAVESAPDLEALGEALDQLATLEPGLAELVDLKFFCGFSFAEIAAMRGVSERTVQRDWAKARLLLHEAIGD